MANIKIIISGGGTGGHIFPAIAIANAIKSKRQDVEFLFVGAKGRMEMTKVPEAGYEIVGLPIMGLQRRLTIKNLKFPFMLLKSAAMAKSIIKRFKPDIAIGVGGYASGPMLRAAAKARIPYIIQEQNSYAGLTNKILGKKANRVCVAYQGMEKFFPKDKIVITGNPVRKEVVKLEGKRLRGMEHFGLDQNKKTLLIVGGSLGAWSINEGVEKALKVWKTRGFQLIWQTGKLFIDRAEAAVKGEEDWIKVTPFIKRMDLAYAAADLIVSRAGALAVSEICLIQKPSILVPLPSAAEDHQTKNAEVLSNLNAASLLADSEVKVALGSQVELLIDDADKLSQFSKNIQSLGYPDAADIIANEALSLVK